MAQFRYIAKSRTGERQEGVMEAPDKRALLAQLGRLGLVPISVADLTDKAAGAAPAEKAKAAEKASAKASAKAAAKAAGAEARAPARKWFRFEKGFRGKPRMRLADLLLFTGELSDLLA